MLKTPKTSACVSSMSWEEKKYFYYKFFLKKISFDFIYFLLINYHITTISCPNFSRIAVLPCSMSCHVLTSQVKILNFIIPQNLKCLNFFSITNSPLKNTEIYQIIHTHTKKKSQSTTTKSQIINHKCANTSNPNQTSPTQIPYIHIKHTTHQLLKPPKKIK